MLKKWMLICSIVCIAIFALIAQRFSVGTVILGLLVGSYIGIIIASIRCSSEISKRRRQHYPLEQGMNLMQLKKLIETGLEHEKVVEIQDNSPESFVISTTNCSYTLKITNKGLSIYERLHTSKRILAALLFRPASSIALAKEARGMVPLIYKSIRYAGDV